MNCVHVWSVIWKAELVSNETEYLSKLLESEGLHLLTAYGKMWKYRNDLKKTLLSKNEAEFKDFENSQPIHIKNENMWSEENAGYDQVTIW